MILYIKKIFKNKMFKKDKTIKYKRFFNDGVFDSNYIDINNLDESVNIDSNSKNFDIIEDIIFEDESELINKKTNIINNIDDDLDDDDLDDDDDLNDDLNNDNHLNNNIKKTINKNKKSSDYLDDEEEYDNGHMVVHFRYNTNEHRSEGKHELKWDSIMKGKRNDEKEIERIEEELYTNTEYYEPLDGGIERGTYFEYESKFFMDYITNKNLSLDIYEILSNNTDINFKSNRRKPNKHTFNKMYGMLIDNISNKYSNYEIFVEFSYYFTDNLFNMYKLLDKKYALIIIKELKSKGYLNNLNNINFI